MNTNINNKIINNIKNTYISKSIIEGLGLFSKKSLEKDTLIGILYGQIVEWKSFENWIKEMGKKTIKLSEIGLYEEWNALSENMLLLRLFRTKYGFINHSRNPNIGLKNNIENHNIEIYTLRRINANEELTLDYRKEKLREEYINEKGREFL